MATRQKKMYHTTYSNLSLSHCALASLHLGLQQRLQLARLELGLCVVSSSNKLAMDEHLRNTLPVSDALVQRGDESIAVIALHKYIKKSWLRCIVWFG